MGLVRFIGSIFFLAFSLKTFSYLNNEWGLNVKILMDLQYLSWKGYGAFFISMIAGLIGLVMGQIIGMEIKIENDELAEQLTIRWHYLANTNIIWLALSGAALSLSKMNYLQFFAETSGKSYFYVAIAVATVGSQLIVASFGFSGRIIKNIDTQFGSILSIALPIIIGVLMGGIQSYMYRLNLLVGIIVGLILPFIMIPISIQMWRGDMMMRKESMSYQP